MMHSIMNDRNMNLEGEHVFNIVSQTTLFLSHIIMIARIINYYNIYDAFNHE